jgi:hypothetical protein
MPLVQNQTLKGTSCPAVPSRQTPRQQVVARGQSIVSRSLSCGEVFKCFNISRSSRDLGQIGLRSGMRGMVATKAASGEQHKVAKRMAELKEKNRCVWTF